MEREIWFMRSDCACQVPSAAALLHAWKSRHDSFQFPTGTKCTRLPGVKEKRSLTSRV